MPVEWAVGEVSRLFVGFLQLYEYAPVKEPSQSFSYAVLLYLRIPNSIWTLTSGIFDEYARGGWGCKMRGVHSHESRCLRGRQLRLLFIPSTLNCVLDPARRHDTSNPTLQIILRASLAAAIFHQLWKLFNSLNNRKRVPVMRPVLSAPPP